MVNEAESLEYAGAYKDSESCSRLLEESVAEQKIRALQRELKLQSALSASLKKRVTDLEIELTQAQEKLFYHKAPSNAELWQQLITHRTLVKDLEDRCERLRKEAKRVQEKRAGQEPLVDDFRHRYLISCGSSATNLASTSSTSIRNETESVGQANLYDKIEQLEKQLANKEAEIKEFREELLEGAELLQKAKDKNEELRVKVEQLENEIRTRTVDNSKVVAVNLKLHKRIDRLESHLQELLTKLEGEKERNAFLANELETSEIEHRSDVSRLKSQLHQAIKGLESLSDKQRSGTSIRSGLSHLLAKLRPQSKSQSCATPLVNRPYRRPEHSSKQKR
ncbi:rab11 family-interacting protein 4-like [Varroa destructor]|uniref:Uncharacterized protein n=1 Tax=Varroa destructor TaxID=109461 RepID=A0A7M7K9N5_VARDE|nr:rab11 family-interacting protein 4-like [Varroa destructor]